MTDKQCAPIGQSDSISYGAYKSLYWRADAAFRESLRKGLEDVKAGRVVPWSEVKKEWEAREDGS